MEGPRKRLARGKAFLTNDNRLSKLQELIDVIVLDDFVET
jgi:hypothetical protein